MAAAALLFISSAGTVFADSTRTLTPEEQLNGVQPQKGLIDKAKDLACGAIGWFCGDKGKAPPEPKAPVKGHFVPPAYVPDNREFKGFDGSMVKPGELPAVPADKEAPEASKEPAEDGTPAKEAGQGKFNVAPGQKDSSVSKDSAGFQSVKGKAWTGKDAKPYKDPCPRSQTMDGGACRPMTTAEAAKAEGDYYSKKGSGELDRPAGGCKRGEKPTEGGGCKQMTFEEASAYEKEFQQARKDGKVKSFEEFQQGKSKEMVDAAPGRGPGGKTEYPKEVKALAKKYGLTEKQVYDSSVSEFKKLLEQRDQMVPRSQERADLDRTIESWKKDNPFLKVVEWNRTSELIDANKGERVPKGDGAVVKGAANGVPPAAKDVDGNSFNYVARGIETVGGKQTVHLKGTDGKWYQAELPKDMQGVISNGQQLSFEALKASGVTVKPREVADAQEKWLRQEDEQNGRKKAISEILDRFMPPEKSPVRKTEEKKSEAVAPEKPEAKKLGIRNDGVVGSVYSESLKASLKTYDDEAVKNSLGRTYQDLAPGTYEVTAAFSGTKNAMKVKTFTYESKGGGPPTYVDCFEGNPCFQYSKGDVVKLGQ